jgi:hypothetical protein
MHKPFQMSALVALARGMLGQDDGAPATSTTPLAPRDDASHPVES